MNTNVLDDAYVLLCDYCFIDYNTNMKNPKLEIVKLETNLKIEIRNPVFQFLISDFMLLICFVFLKFRISDLFQII